MRELLRSNDLVVLSWAQAILAAEAIPCVLLDDHVSGVEGSIGAIPRRLDGRGADHAERRSACSTRLATPSPVPEALTTDRLLGGRVRLGQPAEGYRVAIDPVLLAAAVPARSRARACSTPAAAAALRPCASPRACRAAGSRVSSCSGRCSGWPATTSGSTASPRASRSSRATSAGRRRAWSGLLRPRDDQPAPSRRGERHARRPRRCARAAHVEQALDLAAWLAGCLRMLRPGGLLTLIHRADRLAEVLAALARPTGELVVFPLWPRPGDRPAKRILVQGRKGSRGPLRPRAGPRAARGGRALQRAARRRSCARARRCRSRGDGRMAERGRALAAASGCTSGRGRRSCRCARCPA